MKKTTIAFVFAALSIGTVGCNKSTPDTATPEPPAADAPAAPEAPEAPEAPAADDAAAE